MMLAAASMSLAFRSFIFFSAISRSWARVILPTVSRPATWYLKEATKLKSGAAKTGRETVGKITRAQLREIAEKKMKDLNANDIEAAAKMIAGSARSMGIQVEG